MAVRELQVGITAGKGASPRAEIIAFSWPPFKQRETAYMPRRRGDDAIIATRRQPTWLTPRRIAISSSSRYRASDITPAIHAREFNENSKINN